MIVAAAFSLGYVAMAIGMYLLAIPTGKAMAIIAMHVVFSGLCIFATFGAVTSNKHGGDHDGP